MYYPLRYQHTTQQNMHRLCELIQGHNDCAVRDANLASKIEKIVLAGDKCPEYLLPFATKWAEKIGFKLPLH